MKIPYQKLIPKEPKWSSIESNNISIEVNNFISMGAVTKVKPCRGQYLSNIFLTQKSDGSNRLIINLKSLNNFVKTDHFKIEDHKIVIRLLREGYYMASLDLKNAYTLISINKTHRKYLRFKFRGEIYQFNCLPFGLNCAPLLFTKIMKPVISILRNKGFISVIYLDDILLMGETFLQCQKNVEETTALLEILGFVINTNKSEIIPSQKCKFLGFYYDSIQMSVSLPREKIVLFIRKLMASKYCKIRDFARFIGCLTSACPAVSYGWLYSKSFEREKFLALKNSGGNFNSLMVISEKLSEDFQWWLSNIDSAKNSIRPLKFQIEIFSDASLSGWGIYCNGKKSHGFWNLNERKFHINYLELLAAFFALKCFAAHLTNSNILCRIDNTTAISYINRMGSIQFPKLNDLARKIWQWCEDRNLYIFASYIKSKDNSIADRESRILNIETEWELNNRAYDRIISHFQVPEIDLFASRINRKCSKYVAWLRDPEAWAVDAFTLDWKNFYFYAFPPFSLILRVLQKISTDKAEGIMVVPNWTTQPWYPVFLSLLTKPPLVFQPHKNLTFSFDRTPHPLWKDLSLVAGALSYKRCN